MQKVLSGFVQVLFLEPFFQAFMAQSTLCLFIAGAWPRQNMLLAHCPLGWGPEQTSSLGPVFTAETQTGIFAIPFFSCFSPWQLPTAEELGMNWARPGVGSPICRSASVFSGLVTQRAGHWAEEEKWKSLAPGAHLSGHSHLPAREPSSPLEISLPLQRTPAPLNGLGDQQK